MAGDSSQILQRVQLILRRDLKLGADAPITVDMPFFGSDIDLDSLDILLLVTSIEKEFGVKIPSNAVGKEIFQSVGTLVRYIEQHNGTPNAEQKPGTQSQPADLLSRLPHGAPFRFVTELTDVRAGQSAEGIWKVDGSEAFFAGHFPGNPLVPGVLIAEALAQLSGLAGPAEGRGGMLAHVDVRFDKPVAPPAKIVLRSKLTRVMGALQQFDVAASVGGVTIASGSITLARH